VLLLADAYINKKKEAKAKKKKKKEKHRRMFIDFLRIGHWQKEKNTQGLYFWRRCQQHHTRKERK
jgi:hypothetical protein